MKITFTKRVISLKFIKIFILPLYFIVGMILFTGCNKEDDINPLAPAACFEVPSGNLYVDISLNFHASCSRNADTYKWEFNDGWKSSSKEFTRTFSQKGNYSLTLTVTDSLGAMATEQKSFVIQDSPYIIHEGAISQDEVWVEGLHLIKNDVFISGATVTIEPGAEIYVNKGRSIFIGDTFESSSPTIFKAEGTAEKPIKFLPASGVQAPGEWGHLYFTPNALPESALVHCQIEYGGKASIYYFVSDNYESHGIVSIEDTRIKIENTTIKGGAGYGVRTFQDNHDSAPGFTSFINNNIIENIGHPLKMEINGVHTIGTNNTYSGKKGILIYGWNLLQEDVRWIKQSVPFELSQGLKVGGNTSTGSYTLTLEPGTEILMHKEAYFWIESSGHLKAEGTADAPILFSSVEDVKAKGDWRYIIVLGQSTFNYCTFEYGGSDISNYIPSLLYVGSNGTTVNNCIFRESATDGLVLFGDGLAASSNNHFSNCSNYGLRVMAQAAHLIDNTHTFNCEKNIILQSFSIDLTESVTWTKRSFPYYLEGELAIRNNVNGVGSLTIEPGTEIRFLPEAGIIVGSTFIADGTNEAITFTIEEASRSDKSKYWNGIYFTSLTSSTSKMINCNVSYGGNYDGSAFYGMVHCSITTNTPTIKNCNFTHSASHGISLESATPITSGNTFSNNTGQNTYTW